jgi:nitrogenase molybdenum-iron protein alpha/beta subunit
MTRRFRIPLVNHRRLFGVFLAAHAIPDAIDVLLTGVGCKPKAQRQIALHDRMREAQNKLLWPDISDAHLIAGPESRLRDMTVETVRRRGDVGIVFITTSTAMEMTAVDVPSVAAEISKHVSCPVISIPTPGYDGDLHLGYAAVMREVLALCDWTAPPTKGTVNLIGYPFDRYEMDHPVSIREIERMLAGVGLKLSTTFLSGTPVKGLLEAPRASHNLLMPTAASIEPWVRDSIDRPCAAVPLPIGIDASERFLLETCRLVGVEDGKARAFAARERERIAPLLRVATERLSGRTAAVVADAPLATGLVSLLSDLGVTTTLLGLLDRTLGRDDLPPVPTILEDPSPHDLVASWKPVDLILSPSLWLPEDIASDLAHVEIGFPSNRRHVLYGQPVTGFRGAVALAQRLLDAISGVH